MLREIEEVRNPPVLSIWGRVSDGALCRSWYKGSGFAGQSDGGAGILWNSWEIPSFHHKIGNQPEY